MVKYARARDEFPFQRVLEFVETSTQLLISQTISVRTERSLENVNLCTYSFNEFQTSNTAGQSRPNMKEKKRKLKMIWLMTSTSPIVRTWRSKDCKSKRKVSVFHQLWWFQTKILLYCSRSFDGKFLRMTATVEKNDKYTRLITS